MQVKPGRLSGLFHIYPQVYRDERGYFLEVFEKRRYQTLLGITDEFVQDNRSYSAAGVIRGLHFQQHYPQGKLIRVVSGAVFDVAVDLRADSATFGQWESVVLSADDQAQLWIPPGFAHGFAVLSPQGAEVEYKCTGYYHAGDERCLRWDDPALQIPWPVETPILSEKDQQGLTLEALRTCGYC